MKTIAKRLIAAIAAMTMLIPSASVWAAKGDTDVDIAFGKPAVHSHYENGEYAGGNDDNVTSGSGIFISDAGWNADNMGILTIDLGARYPINQIDVWNYYGYYAKGNDIGYYPEDVVFDFYVTNTKPASKTDAPADAVKLSVLGDSKFIDNPSGGFDSHFTLDTVASYRYVQLRFFKGTNQNTAFRIGQINVWTTAEAAANVPTVVSVGKRVYSNFSWGYNHNLDAFNDGNHSTAHWVYIGKSNIGNALYGFKLDEDTKEQIYDADGKPVFVEGFFDHVIDLEAKFPIEKVVVDQNKSYEGSVNGVLVSNDPSFTSSVPLSYDANNNEYYLNSALVPVFGTDFKYVKVLLTPGVRGNDWMVAINEVSVYSTSQAAAAATDVNDRTNIALGKKVTTNAGSGAYYANSGPERATDGSTSSAFYAEWGGQAYYLTIDLGSAYAIEEVTSVEGTNFGTSGRCGDVSKVLVSNDPNFNEGFYETYEGGMIKKGESETQWKYAFSSTAKVGEQNKYRYVRVYRDLNGVGTGWNIGEVEVFTSTDAASLKNVSLDSTASFINGGGVAGGTIEGLLDGNSSTHCYSYGGMAVIKLPYPMTIEQIEVDSRPGYDSLTGNFTNLGGYNIWLSHEALTGDSAASMPAGTVKVSSATRTDQTGERLYHAGATVVTEVEDENRYSYITVQCPGNGEFFIYDVRILSNDVIEGSNITNELTGEKAKGEVLTLTTSWRCETAPTETVNLYIARYDNGALTDVKMSGDKTLGGQVGSESFEYTITEDVTAQTEFKGFVWEKGTLNPFA